MVAALLAPVVTAFADNIYVEGDAGADGYIQANYHEYSKFTVSIPTQISTGDMGSVYVMSANIEPTQAINVYITNLDENGLIPLYYEYTGENSLNAFVQYADTFERMTPDDTLLASFSAAEIDEAFLQSRYPYSSFYIQVAEHSEMAKAGDYYGMVCYRVECSEN